MNHFREYTESNGHRHTQSLMHTGMFLYMHAHKQNMKKEAPLEGTLDVHNEWGGSSSTSKL